MAASHIAINTFHNEAVSSNHIIYSEILSVTSVMRKNSRWSSSMHTFYTKDSALASNLGLRRPGSNNVSTPQQGNREEDLMSGFEELKRSLRSAQGVCSISDARGRCETYVCPLDVPSRSLTDILSPFLSVIRSPLSTGPITSAALSALHSFFSCGFFLKNDPSVDIALAAVSSSVSHCKFEASDSSGDEVVLLRILTVIEDCMCGVWGTRLGDIEVCEMLETVLATCVQMRLGGLSFRIVPRCDCSHIMTEALRRSAELTMHKLVRTVLSKLHILDPVSEEKRLLAVPNAPAAGADRSMPTQAVEPASGDPAAASQPLNLIAESPQETSRAQKLDCMLWLWHCLPIV
jgi:brefeldin A-resistance guanine nucleotide exchange factor 1